MTELDKRNEIFDGEYMNGQIWKGKLKKFYENGNIKSEGEYSNGKLNGKYKEYYENGTLSIEAEYLLGNKNGKYKEYYEDGKLSLEIDYLGDLQTGNGKDFYENGKIEFEGEYFASEKNGKGKLYNKKGEIIFDGIFFLDKQWDGKGKEYFEEENDEEPDNSILKYEGEYKNGKRHGKGKEYNKKGQLIFEGIYVDGNTFEGLLRDYSEDGDLLFELEMKNGVGNGKAIVWSKYEKGKIEFQGEIRNSSQFNGISNENDDEEGELKIEGEFKNGKFTGKVEEKNKKGLWIKSEYRNGKVWTGTPIKKRDNSIDKTDKKLFKGEYYKGRRWKGKGKEYIQMEKKNLKVHM